MDKAKAFRKKYNDAGVLIEIVKVDGIFAYSDAALDYVFKLAKALGARAISTEIAEEGPQRLGKFADKHQLMVGYHGHEATGPEEWEKLFAYAKHNGANLDIGHFVVRRPRLAGAVPQAAPRSHHPHPRQGSQGAQGRQRAVRRRATRRSPKCCS